MLELEEDFLYNQQLMINRKCLRQQLQRFEGASDRLDQALAGPISRIDLHMSAIIVMDGDGEAISQPVSPE